MTSPSLRPILPAVLAGLAGAAGAADLTVDIAGIGSASGDIRVALYADPAAFDARTPFRARSLPASVPTLAMIFANLPAGDYAVLAYHDIDGDGALRRGAFGIPSEPWTGSTRGSRFRAPSWAAYVVSLPEAGLALALEL